jgi:hypothetical protein
VVSCEGALATCVAALLFAEGVKGQVRSLSFGSLSIARAHSASRRGD